jgi:hypothetical protein
MFSHLHLLHSPSSSHKFHPLPYLFHSPIFCY